ncbi:ABC transporter permease [Sellimonas sp.]|uniref:ABC transporter permease n=1 Tax=Sellimonas sp. TaxID=2021466 RepID=UPI00257FF5C1|nr:FtsX-like permease family protein [Sellimonas sp.]
MLVKIVIKSFKNNIKKYILFFTSNIIAVAELFLFWGLNDIVQEAVRDELTAETLTADFRVMSKVIVFIAVTLIIYSMQYYVRLRMKDYTTFIVLGMKKKTSVLLLLTEYSLGCAGSLVAGLLLGDAFLYGVQAAMFRFKPDFITVTRAGFDVYKEVVLVSLGVMVVVFVGLMVWMEEQDLGKLMIKGERNEKRPVKKWWIGIVFLGAALTAVGAALYKTLEDGYIVAPVIWIISLFLIVYFGLALLLEGLRKRRKFYSRHMMHLNQLYSRYQNNMLVLLILLAVYFYAMTYPVSDITAAILSQPDRGNYPYDAVWYAQEKDKEFSEQLTEKYDGQVSYYPMIRMSTRWGKEQVGVSASTYKDLTGKQVELEGQQILVGVETQKSDEGKPITNKTYQKLYHFLFVGKFDEEGKGAFEVNERDSKRNYEIQDIINQNVLGQYFPAMGSENMIVMSDEYFESQWKVIQDNPEESSMLTLLCFPEEKRTEAAGELKAYAEKYGVKTNLKPHMLMEQTLYVTDDFLHDEGIRLLFMSMCRLFILSVLFISTFFVTGLRSLSEQEFYKKRYDFLESMGMKRRDQRRLIRFETGMLSYIAAIASFGMACVYMVVLLSMEKEAGGTTGWEIWKMWGMLVILFIAVNLLVQWLFAQYMIKRLGKGGYYAYKARIYTF